MATIEPYREVSAIFRPVKFTDLKPGVAVYIGVRLNWLPMWKIEDGPYEGQYAMMPICDPAPPFAWVPECDLAEIQEVPEWTR